MGRPRKNVSDTTPTDAARGPSRVFARRPAGERGALTHDTLTADLDAFRRAGGTIEVLGTTPVLRKIGQAVAVPSPEAHAVRPVKPRR